MEKTVEELSGKIALVSKWMVDSSLEMQSSVGSRDWFTFDEWLKNYPLTHIIQLIDTARAYRKRDNKCDKLYMKLFQKRHLSQFDHFAHITPTEFKAIVNECLESNF